MCGHYPDNFCWYVEGVLTLVAALIGYLGNIYSLKVFSRQKDHKTFHHLLLLLAIFDTIYLTSVLVIFCIPKFSQYYATQVVTYIIPYLLPVAHVGLMGSTYSTLALGIERYIAVCHPFLARGGFYKTRWFIVPVVGLSLTYNIPKFFELKLIFAEEDPNMFEGLINHSTTSSAEHQNDQQQPPFTHLEEMGNITVDIAATELRLNQHYIFIYIFVINCIVNLLIPFILLMILNLKTYKRIQEYEQRLSHFPQFKVIFNRNAQSSNQDFQEDGSNIGMKVGTDNSSTADDIIETETIQAASRGASLDQPMINDNEELQHDLQCFFEETNIGVSSQSTKSKNESSLRRIFQSSKRSSEGERSTDASSILRTNDDVIRPSPSEPSTTIGGIGRSFSQIESQPFVISGNEDGRKQAFAVVISARQREVALARVSIYIVIVFLICHTVRIIPNSFEMVQTFIHKTENFPWPPWIQKFSSISHFLLTLTSSSNFFIYFFKYGNRHVSRSRKPLVL